MLQGLDRSPTRPFDLLRLPPHLRRRIYLYLGVARFDKYPNTYFLDGHKESRWCVSSRDPPSASNFTGLLLSCRVLYAEVAALLYSANRFVMHYPHHRSLKPLRALTPTSLAALTSLKIVLNESSCHNPTDSSTYPPGACCDNLAKFCTQYHGTKHNRPLLESPLDTDFTSAKLAAQAMLAEWQDTAAYLSSHVNAGRLDLWLEVTWSREHRGYQLCRPPCIKYQGGCAPHIHHGCLLSRCRHYAQDGLLYNRSHGCFCRRRHGAASSTCICWAPPSSLFLVCRALCRDAQFVFFSENHFTIRDFHAELPFENLRHHDTSPIATDYPYRRLAVSKFLRDVLLLPIYVTPKCLDRDALEREWRATLDWVRDKINPPVLTIRCVMLCPCPSIDPTGLVDDILALNEDEETRVLKSHTRTLSPLESFTRDVGLASFDVQIAHYTYPGPDRQRYLLQQFKKIGQFPVENWWIKDDDDFRNSSDKIDPRDGTWQRWFVLSEYH
ncbi:hypothetical protein C7999DRAFT_44896 [Corynascus novoguineensis]|uniref:Uncharacterized protein n=1 Tax=Corynascus novoguineensis TaxID=1126955 RepID=A0AAN7CJM0_9PEZI|nr:hypothetical protein C7999DRAFT_44896 [Corynascus novoguineensis]